MSTKIGGRPIPKLTIDFPEGGSEEINLTGPVVARFFKYARKAMGYADKPLSTWMDAIGDESLMSAIEMDFDTLCEAVDGLFPEKMKEKLTDPATGALMLDFTTYTDLFKEAWQKANGLIEEPDEKKVESSAE